MQVQSHQFPPTNSRQAKIKRDWPSAVSDDLKNKMSQLFCLETGSDVLQESTCACCVRMECGTTKQDHMTIFVFV
jgi:hypothetical protein